MEKKDFIDCYIEEVSANGILEEHKMYLDYNGIEACYLHQFPVTTEFAINFKNKLNCMNDEMIFTDNYGWKRQATDCDTVLSSITGLDNIDKSLISLIYACINPSIQANLTVYIADNEYKLVSENKKNLLSKKQINKDTLYELSLAIEKLKIKENKSIIQKIKIK